MDLYVQNRSFKENCTAGLSPTKNDTDWKSKTSSTDIHVLFASLNKRFFWGRLQGVEVRWSPRMTSSAGLCLYRRSQNYCSIRLSAPLLKLRPHSDLVDTLLHEMIHAYLFVTNNNKDRNGHGNEFHNHMYRINNEAGTNITVYHSFHAEVKMYQQHWWRCSGPCQYEAPYYGMVKRAMNRAPGPNDRWWYHHEILCGGTFIKIREPEKKTKKTAVQGVERGPVKNITNYNVRTSSTSTDGKAINDLSDTVDLTTASDPFGKQKAKNIAGFVDLTLDAFTGSSEANPATKRKKIPAFVIDLTNDSHKKKLKTDDIKSKVCKCPVCNKSLPKGAMNEHLESCEGLEGVFEIEDTDDADDCEDDDNNKPYQQCPICAMCIEGDMKLHVDDCLNTSGVVNILDEYDSHIRLDESFYTTSTKISISKYCPLCALNVEGDIKSHLANCVNKSGIFDDEIRGESPNEFCDIVSTEEMFSGSKKDEANSCPVCSHAIKGDLTSHIRECMNNSGVFSNDTVNIDESPLVCDINNKSISFHSEIIKSSECNQTGLKPTEKSCFPVCNQNVDSHLDQTLVSSCLFNDSDEPVVYISDSDSPFKVCDTKHKVPKSSALCCDKKSVKTNTSTSKTEGLQNCPVCDLEVGVSMGTHVPDCLNNSGLLEDLDEQVIVLSDSDSPVKLFDREMKVPKPIITDDVILTDVQPEEVRVVCRVCGMRYGVSKFNGHVCYPSNCY